MGLSEPVTWSSGRARIHRCMVVASGRLPASLKRTPLWQASASANAIDQLAWRNLGRASGVQWEGRNGGCERSGRPSGSSRLIASPRMGLVDCRWGGSTNVATRAVVVSLGETTLEKGVPNST